MRIHVAVTLMLAGLSAGPGSADDKAHAPTRSNYEHLKVLEKAVGQWEGTFTAGGKTSAAILTVEWMLDKQFLKEELRLTSGGKQTAVAVVYGWDAKAGGMALHGFSSTGDSGSGTGKLDAAEGKVSFTSSLVWGSGRKVSMKRVVEFPEADRMVITDQATQDGAEMAEAKLEFRRKK